MNLKAFFFKFLFCYFSFIFLCFIFGGESGKSEEEIIYQNSFLTVSKTKVLNAKKKTSKRKNLKSSRNFWNIWIIWQYVNLQKLFRISRMKRNGDKKEKKRSLYRNNLSTEHLQEFEFNRHTIL